MTAKSETWVGSSRASRSRPKPTFRAIALLVVAGIAGPVGGVQAGEAQGKKPADERAMSETVQELVRMQEAGLLEGIQTEYVRAKARVTRPSCDELIYLHNHQVKDDVIVALLKKTEEATPSQPTTPAPSFGASGSGQPAPQVVYQTPTVTAVSPPTPQYYYSPSYYSPSYYYYPWYSGYPYYGYRSYPSVYLGFGYSGGWRSPNHYGYGGHATAVGGRGHGGYGGGGGGRPGGGYGGGGGGGRHGGGGGGGGRGHR